MSSSEYGSCRTGAVPVHRQQEVVARDVGRLDELIVDLVSELGYRFVVDLTLDDQDAVDYAAS